MNRHDMLQRVTDRRHPWALAIIGGGATGYAINPARDLGPRLAHALLPVPDKRGSDWSYAWVAIVGPIASALLAVLVNTVAR